jgi:hypothetical protein
MAPLGVGIGQPQLQDNPPQHGAVDDGADQVLALRRLGRRTRPAAGHDPEAGMEKADHAMGLELQIVELVEQRTRAEVQGRAGDAARIEREIDQLRAELVATAELAIP